MTMRWVISSGLVEVHFDELLEDKPMAICVLIEGKRYWLPKSQIDFRPWSKIVEVPEWLATVKGLI